LVVVICKRGMMGLEAELELLPEKVEKRPPLLRRAAVV
jgi:hypothetical protein